MSNRPGEMSEATRMVLFVLLMIIVLAVWSRFFKPPAPPPGAKPGGPAGLLTQTHPAQPQPQGPAKPRHVAVVTASQEQISTIESPLYEVELSNRGAAVRAWRLQNYLDSNKPLDLVDADAAQELGWPLSLLLSDPQLEQQANSALYQVSVTGASAHGEGSGHYAAPATVSFHWSNGHLDVTKKLSFGPSYELSLDASVMLDGKPLPFGIAWRGGFGDRAASKGGKLVNVFYKTENSLTTRSYTKLGVSGNRISPVSQSAPFEFLGIEDQFFAAAFLPPAGGATTLWDWTQWRHFTVNGAQQSEPVAEMAAGPDSGAPTPMRMYVGPKDVSILSHEHPSLSELVSFGWTSFLAKLLLYALKWVHNYVPNYGWAIVVLTLAINLPLFPLKVMSQRSMQRMQVIAPEMRAIQDRYKKYSMTDPRRRKMQEEMMELYQKHGINPLPIGTCLPMLVQLPIWWALDRVLEYAIELRHSPWIGWIHDLSARDPYFIIPIAMALAMYAMTAMTPQAAQIDPAQQKMMKLMPLGMGIFFFNLPSGFNLYILTSSLVGAGQQYYLNRTRPMPTRSKFKKKQKQAQ